MSWLAFLALAACNKAPPETGCGDGVPALDDGTCAPAGCAPIDGATSTVTGGGTALADALAAAAAGDVLDVEPGAYDGEVEIPAGVRVAGWCPELVSIEAGYARANIEVDGATGVALGGVTLIGGFPAIYVAGGGGETVELTDLVIRSAGTFGVRVAGDAVVAVDGLLVEDTIEGGDSRGGRGLSVQGGADVSVRASTFANSVEAGIVVDGSTITLVDVTVRDTASTVGSLGRGIQVQNGSSLQLSGASRLESNGDAGVCVLDSDASIRGVTVSGTREVGGIGGDGIAVFRGSGAGDRVVSIEDVTVEDNARAAILVDGVSISLGGQVTTSGNAWSVVGQSGAEVANPDAISASGGETTLFDDTRILGINDEPMW